MISDEAGATDARVTQGTAIGKSSPGSTNSTEARTTNAQAATESAAG
ncbi:hypothetical protein [Methylobacterium sp. J-088]|nr:hypothetical protein [Methylobacterium sp. J-088]